MKPLYVPILGILSYVIVNWDTKNIKKKNGNTAIFGLKIYLFAYNSKTIWRAKLKFGFTVGAYECFTQTEFGGAGHVIKILQAENGHKVDEFELIYRISVMTDIDEKWFVGTVNRLSFGYVRLPQLEN